MKTQHTPTPWSFEDLGKGRGRSARHIFGLRAELGGKLYAIGTVYGICEEDRAFTVRAVNAHEELVAALDLAATKLSALGADAWVLHKIEAAIAKAEGL